MPAAPGSADWAVKVTMAVTGLVWAAFALVHLYGNLKVYAGPGSFNAYAAWLREAFYPLFPHTGVLWALRVVLVVSLVLHVWGALVLWRRNRLARGPVRTRRTGWVGWTAWLMLPTGFLILAFLVAHVLDLTIGAAPVAPEAFEPAPPGDSHAYANLVASLSRPWTGSGMPPPWSSWPRTSCTGWCWPPTTAPPPTRPSPTSTGLPPVPPTQVPDGDPATAWDRRRAAYRTVGPLNRRQLKVAVVGTGLAGAGAAAALAELGCAAEAFTFHDAPRPGVGDGHRPPGRG